ncbi:unnamed protein product, partial [Urochloa humidicola]
GVVRALVPFCLLRGAGRVQREDGQFRADGEQKPFVQEELQL